MNEEKIIRRLDRLERKLETVRREAAHKGHTFIILALCILLLRSCH